MGPRDVEDRDCGFGQKAQRPFGGERCQGDSGQ